VRREAATGSTGQKKEGKRETLPFSYKQEYGK